MPDVLINKKRFYNPADYALKKIGGTWKMPVLYRLQKEPKRYSVLQRDIPHISQKMLTSTLKELESEGLIEKKVYNEVPPRTEYTLTSRGKEAIKVIKVIRDFGLALMKEEGIDYEKMTQEERKK
jgi:DNA-binding HxlR family transcriptional regulator